MDSVTEMTVLSNKEEGIASCVKPPPVVRRGIRKKTLSLNPEEREALENLVEEVILEGGIGDSPSSDEDDGPDSESKQQANGPRASKNSKNGAQGDGHKTKPESLSTRKYYPGQLKVALKHMSDIPPRFSRKLKKAEKYLEMNGLPKQPTPAVIAEEDEEDIRKEHSPGGNQIEDKRGKEQEKLKMREGQVKEAKKVIRFLLNDMNQYSDETTVGVSADDSSITDSICITTSNGLADSCISSRAGPISCEDLERELLGGADTTSSTNHYNQQSAESHSDARGTVSFSQSVGGNYSESDDSVVQFSDCNYVAQNQDAQNSIAYPTSFHTPSVLYSSSEAFSQDSDFSSSYYIRSPASGAHTSIVSAPAYFSSGDVYNESSKYMSPISQLESNYVNDGINEMQLQMMTYGSNVSRISNEFESNMTGFPMSQDMMVPIALSMSMSYAVPKTSPGAVMLNSSGAMLNAQLPPGIPHPYSHVPQAQGLPQTQVQGVNSTVYPSQGMPLFMPPGQGMPPNKPLGQGMPTGQGMPPTMPQGQGMPPNYLSPGQGMPPNYLSQSQGMPPNLSQSQGIPPNYLSQSQGMPPNMLQSQGMPPMPPGQEMPQFRGLSSSHPQTQGIPSATYHQQFTMPPPPYPPPPNHPLTAFLMPNGDINLSHPQASMLRFPPPNLVSSSMPPYSSLPLHFAGSDAAALYACMPPPTLMISKSSGQSLTNSNAASSEKSNVIVNGAMGSSMPREACQIGRSVISIPDSTTRPQSANDRMGRTVHNSFGVDGGRSVRTQVDSRPFVRANDLKNITKFHATSPSKFPISNVTEEDTILTVAAQRDYMNSQTLSSNTNTSSHMGSGTSPALASSSSMSPKGSILNGYETTISSDISDISPSSNVISSINHVSTTVHTVAGVRLEPVGVNVSAAAAVTGQFRSDTVSAGHHRAATEADHVVTIAEGVISSSTATTASSNSYENITVAGKVSKQHTAARKTARVSFAQQLDNGVGDIVSSPQQSGLCNGGSATDVNDIESYSAQQQIVCSNTSVGSSSQGSGASDESGAVINGSASDDVELMIGEELVRDLNQLFGHRLTIPCASRVRIPIAVARQLYDSLLESTSEVP